ncbi:MAG: alpha/beta fold hydrolase [Pyrinomonadaceae bacterium]
MKCLILFCWFLFAVNVAAQSPPVAVWQNAGTQCGDGEFLINLNGTQVGTETFKVECPAGGGYQVTGKTVMEIGAAKLELASTLETNAASWPSAFSMKGTSFGTPVDQTLSLKDGIATVVKSGATSTVDYTTGAAFVPNNISYPFQFVTNRYDRARGGVQEVVVFPNAQATIEFIKFDEIQTFKVSDPQPKFARYLLQFAGIKIFVWTDDVGRVLVIQNPGQKFSAVRKEFAGAGDELMKQVSEVVVKPDYSAPAGALFTAEEVTVQAKGHTLAGTLLLPKNAKGRVPAVITITGSGQETRDEPLPFPNLKNYRPFRQIAEALAARGIAVLRVDDRGVGDSTGLDGIDNATSADFADDTRAQVAYLRGRKEIDPNRIALAGHSEGGIIAPMVAADDLKIAAIVLLAGTGQRGSDVLLYQFNRPIDNEPTMSDADKVKARAENAAMIRTTMEGGNTSTFPPILQAPWTKWFLLYDPAPTIRKVKQPILILQGDLDRQVARENADALLKATRAAGNRKVEVHYFPTLNHLFLPAKTGEGSEYLTLTVQEIPAEVLDTLVAWLAKTLKVR